MSTFDKAREFLNEGHNKTNIIRHFEKSLNADEIAALAVFLDTPAQPAVKTVLSSDGTSTYKVERVRGKLVCNCKGFAFRGKCRHTAA